MSCFVVCMEENLFKTVTALFYEEVKHRKRLKSWKRLKVHVQDKASDDDIFNITPEENRYVHIEDNFIYSCPRFHLKKILGVNTNCSIDDDYGDVNRVDKTPYPLTPEVRVDGKIFFSNTELRESDHSLDFSPSTSWQWEEEIREITDDYPQFGLPSMQISKPSKLKLTRINWFGSKKLSKFCRRCRSSEPKSKHLSCSYKFDDVTTLHTLLGDELYESGVRNALSTARGARLRH